MSAEFRIEKDSLGEVKVPAEAYFGAFTVRAQQNFVISDLHAPEAFRMALGLVKLAAAQANGDLKVINKEKSDAIIQACEEFIAGKFNDQFDLDVFQAGAGTSYNMNANEVIANRANELLGGTKGNYEHVNPNNDVNAAQSTNDVIPVASRIAALLMTPELLQELEKIQKELTNKSAETADLLKVGRTHMEDAVPITMGQEFDSYNQAIGNSRKAVLIAAESLKTLGIGGTAVGTGINSDPEYKDAMIKNLSNLLGCEFQSAKNLTEMANNMNDFLNFSAALRSLAVNLLNFVSDLKLMNSGPQAGLKEIVLPTVQPGSSIMPGKINPSIPECLEMICVQVLGNDKTIELSAMRSQFELNTMCPIIMYNLLQSIQILTSGLRTLREFALEELVINRAHIEKTFENSICSATALAPLIGYINTAEVVKAALKNESTIKEEVLKRKLLSEKELEEALSVEATTKPIRRN